VAGNEPADAGGAQSPAGGRELSLRVVSAAVLAPLTVAAAYAGGPVFLLFWTAAACGVLWEWNGLVLPSGRRRSVALAAAGGALVAAAAAFAAGQAGLALALIVAGAVAAAVCAPPERRAWAAAGCVYSGGLLLAPVVLRADPHYGFTVLIFLFAVVWTTDSVAYFVGRRVGGPKLAPRVSPKKTWSGAVAGVLSAVLVGMVVAWSAEIRNLPAVAIVSLVLSVVAQAGDLFESALKRHFGAKDAGHLIPGHGGLMDRLDGFLTAACAGAMVGLVRGGLGGAGGGLLSW
jgi:phosphatidate cytidylyltransferase